MPRRAPPRFTMPFRSLPSPSVLRGPRRSPVVRCSPWQSPVIPGGHLSSPVVSCRPRRSPTVSSRPPPLTIIPAMHLQSSCSLCILLSQVAGPVVLSDNGRLLILRMRTGHLSWSCPVQGSWQSFPGALPGPWTVGNTDYRR